MTTLHLKKSIGWSPLRLGFLLVPLALACFALSPTVRAVNPPPDGGYPGNNTAEGDGALQNLAPFDAVNYTAFDNTAIGFRALFSNTTGRDNTANGVNALFNNKIGGWNTANGVNALFSNRTGSYNTANGAQALYSNTSGPYNTATGRAALFSNRTGAYNTANGFHALVGNTGGQNTANGAQALLSNTTGGLNTATGFNALVLNTVGNQNSATGVSALSENTTGGQNTAYGNAALQHNTTGSSNIALGFKAGVGLTTGDNNIDIGSFGVAGESGAIRIGTNSTATATFIAGISGKTVGSGVGVIVNASGQLGTILSSARFKDGIKPMDKTSEAILALEPVTFRYKQELDPNGIPQFGLIAEQVEKVNPDLVVRGEDGKVTTVRYEAVNAMLLNEFLKEHRRVEQQDARLAKQETTIAQQKKDFASQLARQQKAFEAKFALQQQQVEALTATVQKVSNQLEVNKAVPQVVASNQ